MHYFLCDMIADITQNSVEANASKVTIELNETDHTLQVFITDNGKGMSPETLKKIQDPFYTDGIKHPKRKVGLGIPFLIQTGLETGGKWDISSKLGEGTKVQMEFDLTNIDTPPLGDVPGLFRQLFLLENNELDYEMEIIRKKSNATEQLYYTLYRSETADALGSLTQAKSTLLLGDFLVSQERSES